MKTFSKFVCLFCSFLFFTNSYAQVKPFKRAMIFNGANVYTGVFMGMMSAARKANIAPDLVIGVCGGTIAAAFVAYAPADDEAAQKDVLMSHEFHKFLLDMEMDDQKARLISGLRMMIRMKYRYDKRNRIPDLDREAIMRVQQNPDLFAGEHSKLLGFSFDHLREVGQGNVSIIMQAGEMLYDQGLVGQRRGNLKLYRQAYFTDKYTAQFTKGWQSAVGKMFPDSAVTTETETYLGATVFDGLRAGIADMYVMAPHPINVLDPQTGRVSTRKFITGAIDLDPVEFADSLADEVINRYGAKFEKLMNTGYRSVFHFDENERKVYAQSLMKYVPQGNGTYVLAPAVEYWADNTDPKEYAGIDDMGPRVDLKSRRITFPVPQTYAEFVKLMQKQWDYGEKIMNEAIRFKNSKAHIRIPNCPEKKCEEKGKILPRVFPRLRGIQKN